MFTDPQLVTYGASSAQFSFGLKPSSNGMSQRASAATSVGTVSGIPEMSIGQQLTRENPDAGGSTRTLLNLGFRGSDTATGLVKLNPRVQLVIVDPKDYDADAVVTALLQALVSFLTGETDGSVAADAAVDATVVAKLLVGEG